MHPIHITKVSERWHGTGKGLCKILGAFHFGRDFDIGKRARLEIKVEPLLYSI